MKTVKPQCVAVLTRPYEFEKRFYLAVTASVFFRFDQARHLLSEVSMWKFLAANLGKDAVVDMGMPKLRGEYLVYGNCYAPTASAGQSAMVQVKVTVGSRSKTLHVYGERDWLPPYTGSATPTAAQPFTHMALNYTNAFGGKDYPHNPVGKGMPPPAADSVHCLPNIELAGKPLLSPDDRPAPAGLGPIDFSWPQRASKAGTYDAHWLAHSFPGFAADMDWSIFNAAPEDQWLPGFFTGDEPFMVQGMHPSLQEQRGTLPACAIRCVVAQQRGGNEVLVDVPARAETLVLFPDQQRAILLWRAVVEVGSADADDIAAIIVGVEDSGAPKPLSHYEDVLAIRRDRKQGALHALNDAPLMPVSWPAGAPGQTDEAATAPPSQFLLSQNMRRKTEQEFSKAKEQLAALRAQLVASAGASPTCQPDLGPIDEALASALPPPARERSLEELPAFKKEMQDMASAMLAKAQAGHAQAEANARALCASNELDYDALLAAARARAGGPPAPMAPALVQSLQAVPAAAATGIDPDLPVRLADVDAKAMAMYRRYAHFSPPAASAPGEDKAALAAAFARGDSFEDKDMTGADLAGLNLQGANLRGALLDNANLNGANLTGANLEKAVLAHADLAGALLVKANFQGANLGAANLAGSVARGASFARATLSGANLDGADLTGADLSGADLMGAKLGGAMLSGVLAPGAKFIALGLTPAPGALAGDGAMTTMDLSATVFSGAQLNKALFLHCRMDRSNFQDACLDQAVLLEVDGNAVDFSRASLHNLRAVSNTQLPDSNFTAATLSAANLRGIGLSGSTFAGANMAGCDLTGAALAGTVLTSVRGRGLRLTKADVSNADLGKADLMGANVQQAQLKGASFLEANLFMADFLRTVFDETTVFARANLKNTLLKNAQNHDQG